MILYPLTQSTFSALFMRSLKSHLLTLKNSFIYLVLFVALKQLYFFAIAMPLGTASLVMLNILCALLTLFFFSAALLAIDHAFKGQPISFGRAFVIALNRTPKVYLATILFLLGSYITFYFGRFLIIAVGKLIQDQSAVHSAMLLVSLIMVAVFVAMFCLALPLSAIEKKPLWPTFFESLYLSDKLKFGIFMLFFIGYWLSIFMSPVLFFHASAFVKQYDLGWAVDLLLIFIVGPIFLNLLLLLINDGKIQVAHESD